MFAVIATGGKQYLVKKGDVIHVEKLDAKVGDPLEFDALLVSEDDGSAVRVGAPHVAGGKVKTSVSAHGRADKVKIIKFKAKVRYARRNGHRQPFTELQIQSIQ